MRACIDWVAVLQVPLASIPQFYFPGGAEPMDDEVKQQFVSNVNTLFDAHPAGLNLEQFSAVVQEVSSSIVGHGQAMHAAMDGVSWVVWGLVRAAAGGD